MKLNACDVEAAHDCTPRTLWEAIRETLEQDDTPVAIHEIVKRVAVSRYPGTPTRLRIRAVLRRQILFERVIEVEPQKYVLTSQVS